MSPDARWSLALEVIMACTELGLYLVLEDCFAGSQEGSEVFSLAYMKRLCVLLKWLLPSGQNTGAFQRVGPSVTQDAFCFWAT